MNLAIRVLSVFTDMHDDVIKWKHFPRNWPFVREIHRSPVNFPHKGQWRGALMFSLNYAWINDWVNNREAGDLRRQHGHYDVIVMVCLDPFSHGLELLMQLFCKSSMNKVPHEIRFPNVILAISLWYDISNKCDMINYDFHKGLRALNVKLICIKMYLLR